MAKKILPEIRVVELFAGVGGFRIGLEGAAKIPNTAEKPIMTKGTTRVPIQNPFDLRSVRNSCLTINDN